MVTGSDFMNAVFASGAPAAGVRTLATGGAGGAGTGIYAAANGGTGGAASGSITATSTGARTIVRAGDITRGGTGGAGGASGGSGGVGGEATLASTTANGTSETAGGTYAYADEFGGVGGAASHSLDTGGRRRRQWRERERLGL